MLDDIDDKSEFLQQILLLSLNEFAPLHIVNCKNSGRSNPWFSDSIARMTKEKQKARHLAQRTGNVDNWSTYRRLKDQLKAIVCQAKVDCLLCAVRQIRQCSRKAAYMWSCVNNIIGRGDSPRVALDHSVSLNSINDFFRTVAVSPQHSKANHFVIPPDVGGFTFRRIPESMVLSH